MLSGSVLVLSGLSLTLASTTCSDSTLGGSARAWSHDVSSRKTPRIELETILASSLLQARLSRKSNSGVHIVAPFGDYSSAETPYGAAEVDMDFRNDYVHDNLHGVFEAVQMGGLDDGLRTHVSLDGVMNVSVANPFEAQTLAAFDDNNLIKDDFGAGSVERLCWTPPRLDDTKHKHVWAPIDAQCPAQCPFTQGLQDERCYKACVQAEYCGALHPFRTFGDNASMQCSPTCGNSPEHHVIGCLECSSPGICRRCSVFRSLQKGGRECKDYWKYLYSVLFVCGWLAAISAVLFLLYLQHRPTLSADMLARAGLHRDLCKPWRVQARGARDIAEEPQKYSLFSARTHAEDISGVGMPLYFRSVQLMAIFSLGLWVMLYMAFSVSIESIPLWSQDPSVNSESQLTIMTKPESCHYGELSLVQASQHGQRPKFKINMKLKGMKLKAKARMPSSAYHEEYKPAGSPHHFPRRMAMITGICYFVMTAASLWAVKSQVWFAKRWRLLHRRHSDFTVIASGLPRGATDPAKLRAFFQAALDKQTCAGQQAGEVVGVSIAYDMPSQHGVLQGEQSQKLAKLQEFSFKLQEKVDKLASRSVWEAEASTTIPASPAPSAAVTTTAPTSATARRLTQPLESLLYRLIPHQKVESGDAAEAWEEEARREIRSIEGTGLAYIVLASEHARADLLRLNGLQGLDEVGLISLEACGVEPPSVIWEAHGYIPKMRTIAKNLAILTLTVFVWAALFAPYAYYHMQVEAVPGQDISKRADFVLGMMIAIGNQFVTAMIDINVKQLGIRNKDLQEAANMVLVFLATMMNTALDMCIVMFVLQGISLNMARHGTLDQSHYDRVIASELYGLIMPGYLITPYIMNPLLGDLLPHYVHKRLIRSTTGASQGAVERKFMCPPFDLSWHYSDLLTNFSVCLPLLLFDTYYMYRIMFFLMCCTVVNYCIDHIRFLRATSQTAQLSSLVDVIFYHWWCLPLGILANITVHWVMAAGLVEPGQELVIQVVIFMLHCTVYIAFLRWILHSEELVPESMDKDRVKLKTEVSYKEMCQEHCAQMRFYDYFNTNPVQVLRSWLLCDGSELPLERSIVPCALGKEHLMLLNPEVAKQQGLQQAMRSRFWAAWRAGLAGQSAEPT